MPDTNEPLYYEVLQLLRLNQKRSAFIGSAYGTSLGIAESFMLVEIDVDPDRSAKQLSESLALEKSIISRKISFLVEEGFLEQKRTEADARRKRLILTEKGKDFLRLQDEFNSKQLAEQGARISIEELSELQGYFRQLADGADQPPALLRAGENPLLIEMRRISRAFKIFGTSLADSGYSGLEWQVLSEIHLGANEVRAADISRELGLAPTTVSQIMSRFKRKKLITRKPSAEDKRSLNISLTKTGLEVLQSVDECCLAVIRNAFQTATQKSLKRFIDIFGRYIAASSASSTSLSLRSEIRVKKLDGESERMRARGFLVLQLVRLNRYLEIPESLVAASSYSYSLDSDGKLSGVCEFVPKGKAVELAQFALSADLEQDPLARSFLRTAAIECARECGVDAVELPNLSRVSEWAREISGTKGSRGGAAVSLNDLERWAA